MSTDIEHQTEVTTSADDNEYTVQSQTSVTLNSHSEADGENSWQDEEENWQDQDESDRWEDDNDDGDSDFGGGDVDADADEDGDSLPQDEEEAWNDDDEGRFDEEDDGDDGHVSNSSSNSNEQHNSQDVSYDSDQVGEESDGWTDNDEERFSFQDDIAQLDTYEDESEGGGSDWPRNDHGEYLVIEVDVRPSADIDLLTVFNLDADANGSGEVARTRSISTLSSGLPGTMALSPPRSVPKAPS